MLRDFSDHYWSNMVQLHSNPKEKSTVGRLEILGTTGELQSLINLMSALHEAEVGQLGDLSAQMWQVHLTLAGSFRVF